MTLFKLHLRQGSSIKIETGPITKIFLPANRGIKGKKGQNIIMSKLRPIAFPYFYQIKSTPLIFLAF